MDIQEMITKLLGSAEKEPQVLQELVEHPYSTIRKVTGLKEVSKEQASQVVAGTAAAARGKQIDMGSLAGIASAMLGQSGGSVHSLADMLLGSGSSYGVNMSGGAGGDILSNLFGGGSPFGGGSLFGGSAQGYSRDYQAGYQAGYQAAMQQMQAGYGMQQQAGGGSLLGGLANMLFGM
ncbi:MAG: hypothetical protein ACOYIP_05335 [Coriobacteriales bacterium]|jgi:hypothetical protein